MNDKQLEIFLNKTIIDNKELSENAIIAYVALRIIYNIQKDIYYVSINQLAYELTNEIKSNRYFMDDIIKGINELINNNIIDMVNAVNKTDYILDLSKLYFDSSKEFFIKVAQDEIHKIMSAKNDKMKLFKYFIVLMGTLVNTNAKDLLKDTGAMSQDFLATKSNISVKSIQNYNDVLEKLELIYVYKADDFKYIAGEIQSFTNVYGRLKDKDSIISSAKKHINQCGFKNSESAKIVKRQTTSYNRSCGNKFANIRDKGKKYSYDEMKEIYFAMLEIKANLRDKYFTDELYEENVACKELEPYFKDFDFYVGEEKQVENKQTEDTPMIDFSKPVDKDDIWGKDKSTDKSVILTPAQQEQIEVRSEISVDEEIELKPVKDDVEFIIDMGWDVEEVNIDDVETEENVKSIEFDYQKEFGCTRDEMANETTSDFWNRALQNNDNDNYDDDEELWG